MRLVSSKVPDSSALPCLTKKIRLPRRRFDDLPERRAQTKRGVRRKVEGVVIENDVHSVGLTRELPGSFRDLADLCIAVIVIESLGHCLAAEIGLRIAPMQT